MASSESLFSSFLKFIGWKSEKPAQSPEKSPRQPGKTPQVESKTPETIKPRQPESRPSIAGSDLYEKKARMGHEWGRDREGKWRQSESHFINFLEKYADEIGPNVLDIGCGNGRHLIPLAQKGYNVTGIDNSSKMLDTARRRGAEEGLEFNLEQGNHNQLPFEDNSQDTVVSIQSFQFSDSEKSFLEASRVLKPGGLFFLRVRSDQRYSDDYIESQPHITKLGTNEYGGQEVEVDFPQGKVRYHHYSLRELKRLAHYAGLEMVKEPVDERQINSAGKTEKGQWNVVFRKKE